MRELEIHVEAQLPALTEEMKECDRLAEQTLARIRQYNYEAIKRGHFLRLLQDHGRASRYLHEAREHFKEPKKSGKKNLPIIKVSELKPLERLETKASEKA